jgi:Na+-driven multidrug efflux pump
MVAQAACIGAKDADSPLRAIAIVSVFNIFLDWLFVGPWKLGVAGAAWATAIAQVCVCVFVSVCVCVCVCTEPNIYYIYT